MKFITYFLLALFCLAPALASQPEGLPTAPLTIRSLAGQEHHFEVEIARTPESRRDGLMRRLELKPDRGMLFVFDREGRESFWMKDTLIALDIVFIGSDGRISKIHENAHPNDLTVISSGGPVSWALELPAGRTKELGITAGSVVMSPAMKAPSGN